MPKCGRENHSNLTAKCAVVQSLKLCAGNQNVEPSLLCRRHSGEIIAVIISALDVALDLLNDL